jgi:hypothetical protein
VRALIVGWGLGAGVAVALVDILTRELIRIAQNADLATALTVLDYWANFALFGWAAYRVAAVVRMVRPGLETAVLAGLVAGSLAVAYDLVRHLDTLTPNSIVQVLAVNVIFAALGGVAGAWLGSTRRPDPTGEE